MIDGFEIKCKKCGNTMIDIKGTATKDIKGITTYETKVRVKFTCLFCGRGVEVPVTQNSIVSFDDGLRKKQKEVEYVRFGKKYRKIGRHEKIAEGAMHSWQGGPLEPIFHSRATVGDTPENFSDEREFYNPIEEEKEVHTLRTLLKSVLNSEGLI